MQRQCSHHHHAANSQHEQRKRLEEEHRQLQKAHQRLQAQLDAQVSAAKAAKHERVRFASAHRALASGSGAASPASPRHAAAASAQVGFASCCVTSLHQQAGCKPFDNAQRLSLT